MSNGEKEEEMKSYADSLWNAKPGVPQHLLPGWLGFLGYSDGGRKPVSEGSSKADRSFGKSFRSTSCTAVSTGSQCAD